MDHSELIAEMAYIEKLSTQERLKLARRRRMQQLKKTSQKDKEFFSSKKEKTAHNEQKRQKKNNRNISFANNVMILEAAARNDIDEVRALLDAGVNPDSTNEDGLTALHQCCIDDSEDMMRLLVLYGANVNAQDSEKWTPLHAAATCGHLHLARFLISKGANLLSVNADGNMPYDICEDDTTLDYIEGEMASKGVTQVLIDDTRAAVERLMLQDFKRLKEEGKSLMFRDEQGATPLHIAAANGYINVVDYLLSQNIPTEVQDNDDWSPMHAAACWGHPDVLEMLVQHGGNLNARTKNQETPYDICEDAELRERLMQLINEQETKRLNDQNRRIRRVRSNKRTQSIRRTSVREKTLTPKKEAQEEGRMRLQLENQRFSDIPNLPDICQSSDTEVSDSSYPTTYFSNKLPNFDDNKTNELVNRNLAYMKEFPPTEFKIDKENEERNSEKSEITSILTPEIDIPDSKEIISIINHTIPQINNSSPKTNISVFPEVATNEVLVTKRTAPPVPPPRSSSTILSTSPTPSQQLPVAVVAPSTENISPEAGAISVPSTTAVPSNNNNKIRGSDSTNKIDIHVTVTVNPFAPGTLADLKKQRALSRASQNSFTLSGGGGSSLFSLNTSQDIESPGGNSSTELLSQQPSGGVSCNSSTAALTSFRPPSSPSQVPRRFCGEPSDLIGKNDKFLCCSIM